MALLNHFIVTHHLASICCFVYVKPSTLEHLSNFGETAFHCLDLFKVIFDFLPLKIIIKPPFRRLFVHLFPSIWSKSKIAFPWAVNILDRKKHQGCFPWTLAKRTSKPFSRRSNVSIASLSTDVSQLWSLAWRFLNKTIGKWTTLVQRWECMFCFPFCLLFVLA